MSLLLESLSIKISFDIAKLRVSVLPCSGMAVLPFQYNNIVLNSRITVQGFVLYCVIKLI